MNILALTDFSEAADNAAIYAAKFAAALKANLILFHAASPNVPVSHDSDEMPQDADDDVAADIARKLGLLSKKLGGVLTYESVYQPHISHFTAPGSIRGNIRRLVKDNAIDLIVMGARLYEDFPGFLFGTNVRGVVEEAACPVLLIHEGALYRPVKSMLYATDLRYCDLRVVSLLTNLASRLKSDVSMLHVCTDGLPALGKEEALAIFLDTIASRIHYNHLTHHQTDNQDTRLLLAEIIENQEADILAIAHKKYHFFNHLFRKNDEKDTAVYTRIPILIIPDD